MKVLRPFDFHKLGDVLTPQQVENQRGRGNLPDLVAGGFLEERQRRLKLDDLPALESMSLADVRKIARGKGITTGRKTKARLIELIREVS